MQRALPLVQRHSSLVTSTSLEPDTPTGATLRRRLSQGHKPKRPQRGRLFGLVITAFLACFLLMGVSQPRQRRRGGGMMSAGVGRASMRGKSETGYVAPLYLGEGHGHGAKARVALDMPAAPQDSPQREALPAASLLLASHNRVLWHDIASGTNRIIHEGQGVYHGVFPGLELDKDGQPTSLWLLSRPHNWRPAASQELLVHVDAYSGEELGRVSVLSRFAHDAVRHGDQVYLSSTGDGVLIQLTLPTLAETARFDLFTPTQHLNSLAPLRKDQVWGLLHNLGSSDLVLIDTTSGTVVKRHRAIGTKAHGLVAWHSWLIILDSGNGALARFEPETGKREELWRAPETGMFTKGLAVVDDIAYFGVSPVEPRDARTDPTLDCQLAAFDLSSRRLLWRRQIPTKGLLNVVAAPHLSEASTYAALRTSRAPQSAPMTREEAGEALQIVLAEMLPEVLSHMAEGRRLSQYLDIKFPAQVGGRWASGWPYLDVNLKKKGGAAAGMFLPLTQLPLDLLAEVKAVLKQEGERIWDGNVAEVENAVLDGRDEQQAAIKGQTQAILLLFSDKAGVDVYEFPWWGAKFRDAVTPILEAVLGHADMAKVMRVQLTRLPPRSSIPTHLDVGGYAKSGHRIHVPLQVNSKTSFEACPGSIHPTLRHRRHASTTSGQGGDALAGQIPIGVGDCFEIPVTEGLAFELNNQVLHRVTNKGSTDRIHLLIDVAETPRGKAMPLAPGQHCTYSRTGSISC